MVLIKHKYYSQYHWKSLILLLCNFYVAISPPGHSSKFKLNYNLKCFFNLNFYLIQYNDNYHFINLPSFNLFAIFRSFFMTIWTETCFYKRHRTFLHKAFTLISNYYHNAGKIHLLLYRKLSNILVYSFQGSRSQWRKMNLHFFLSPGRINSFFCYTLYFLTPTVA